MGPRPAHTGRRAGEYIAQETPAAALERDVTTSRHKRGTGGIGGGISLATA
jgi:hypothetical protein